MKTFATFERRIAFAAAVLCRCARLAVIAALFFAISYPSGAAEPANTTATTETNKNADWRVPTRITMKYQDAAPEEVLDELAKAADITLEASYSSGWTSARTITLDVKDRPFWPVFIDACRQARVDFQTSMSDRSPRRIQLTPGNENHLASMPAYEAEGCLLVFQSASRSHQLQYGTSGRGGVRYGGSRGSLMIVQGSSRGALMVQGDGANQASVHFSLQALLLVDPKLRPTGNVRTTLTSAVDENGTSFLQPNDDRTGSVYYSSQPNGLFPQVIFTLNYPTNAGRKLSKLEGNLRLTTILKEETWEISDVLNAKPETKDIDGRSITIQSVRKSQGASGNYDVRITQIVSADGEAPGLRRTPSELYQLAQTVTLMAADGTQLSHSGGGGGPNDAQVSFYSPNSPNKDIVPAKLIWKLPTDSRELVVPFTVTDLPIP
jgi:hypothetical protein